MAERSLKKWSLLSKVVVGALTSIFNIDEYEDLVSKWKLCQTQRKAASVSCIRIAGMLADYQ
ncbi:unnamed protein product [Sphenostylis stenocarpa]|uniref:Uncharacterized protein n=1 Tax=Sphenostylis stenocarpa TaxID=92480 RepID=A0AA86VBI8_9FABA|nr:unnamed protein product [Sphenostylis stenocarpa]